MIENFDKKIKNELISISKKCDEILLIALGNRNSAFSDIDIFLLIDSNCYQTICGFSSIVANAIGVSFGIAHRGYLPGYGYGFQVLLSSGLRLDININGIETINKPWLWETREILLNKWNSWNTFCANARDAILLNNELHSENINFWIEYIKTKKSIKDNNFSRAFKYLNRMIESFLVTSKIIKKQPALFGAIYRSDENNQINNIMQTFSVYNLETYADDLADKYKAAFSDNDESMKNAAIVALKEVSKIEVGLICEE